MNDRSQDVRLEFYNVVFHWMKNMDIHYLKMFEADLVQFLLNGISDDKLDIGPMCIDFLDEHGKRMKEALKALGEDEQEEEQKTDEYENGYHSKKEEKKRIETEDKVMEVNS